MKYDKEMYVAGDKVAQAQTVTRNLFAKYLNAIDDKEKLSTMTRLFDSSVSLTCSGAAGKARAEKIRNEVQQFSSIKEVLSYLVDPKHNLGNSSKTIVMLVFDIILGNISEVSVYDGLYKNPAKPFVNVSRGEFSANYEGYELSGIRVKAAYAYLKSLGTDDDINVDTLKTQMNSQLDHYVNLQNAMAEAPLVF